MATAHQAEAAMGEPRTAGWLERLLAAWLTLVLGGDFDDIALRDSLAHMLAVPAGVEFHGR